MPVAPADPALAGVTSVRLRVGPDFPSERKAAILAALAKAGITGVQVEALPFEIASSRVGYYRAADLAAAEALGRVVAPVIAAGGEVGVRDYGPLLRRCGTRAAGPLGRRLIRNAGAVGGAPAGADGRRRPG